MHKLTIFVSCIAWLCCCVAQSQDSLSPKIPVKVSRTLHGEVFIGADPQRPYERFSQLFDRQLQEHIGLEAAVVDQLQEVVASFRQQRQASMAAERSGEIPRGTTAELSQEFEQKAVQLADELLTPGQQQELTQWMYRMEAKRIGLGHALVEGRLSKAIGVYDNQKTQLTLRTQQIQQETAAAIQQLLAEAEQKILQELSPEQRDKARELLGKNFEYEQLTREQSIYYELKRKVAEEQAADSLAAR